MAEKETRKTPKTPAKTKAAPAKRASKRQATESPIRQPIRLDSSAPPTPEERWLMIAEAAYYRAEKRGFAPGHAEQDWLEAEKEIDKTSGAQGINPA
jgi:hypothetical protein